MNEIVLKGDIGFEITADKLRNKLPKDESDVVLRVNSPGGFMFEGIDLFNLIKDYKGKVIVIIDSLAASAASFFIMAADERKIRRNSTFMAHKTWNIVIGDADDMATQAKISNGYDNILATEYSRISGENKKNILAEMKNEIWLFGNEIIERGFADKFIEGEDLDDGGDDGSSIFIDNARALVDAVKSRMEMSVQAVKKAAAWQKVNKEIFLENNSDQEKNKKEKKGVSMSLTLNELLDQNPEVRAEYESSISAAIEGERNRLTKLLNLDGIIISDELNDAVVNGLETGVYAENKLIAQNKVRKNASNLKDLGTLKNDSQTPADTIPPEDNKTLPKNTITSEEQAEKEAENFYKNKGGK